MALQMRGAIEARANMIHAAEHEVDAHWHVVLPEEHREEASSFRPVCIGDQGSAQCVIEGNPVDRVPEQRPGRVNPEPLTPHPGCARESLAPESLHGKVRKELDHGALLLVELRG
jgi:hypothetical protein